MSKFLFILFLGYAHFAQAYSIWLSEGAKFDKRLPAHVVVSGYSHGMGDQFVQSANARLLRYQELFPGELVILYQPQVESYALPGLKKVFANKDSLLGETLVRELLTYKTIQTLDFFSHSSAHQGVGLETGSVTMPEQSFYAIGLPTNPVAKYRNGTPGIADLRKVLAKDAWITLNGCNNAWLQAPALSRLVGRPVLAAATSTDFQRLFQDGLYYFNNKGQYPTTGAWATQNEQTFTNSKSCSTGACLRMNPAPVPYEGFWGNYTNVGGLGFYKFFCNYEGFESNCYRTMARYLQVVTSKKDLRTSTSRTDYLETLYDFVCPVSPTGPSRANCISNIEKKLARGLEDYNPYSGIPADCDLKSCKIAALNCKFSSSGWATPGTCRFTADPKADGSHTLIREVKNYLRGFDELGIH